MKAFSGFLSVVLVLVQSVSVAETTKASKMMVQMQMSLANPDTAIQVIDEVSKNLDQSEVVIAEEHHSFWDKMLKRKGERSIKKFNRGIDQMSDEEFKDQTAHAGQNLSREEIKSQHESNVHIAIPMLSNEIHAAGGLLAFIGKLKTELKNQKQAIVAQKAKGANRSVASFVSNGLLSKIIFIGLILCLILGLTMSLSVLTVIGAVGLGALLVGFLLFLWIIHLIANGGGTVIPVDL